MRGAAKNGGRERHKPYPKYKDSGVEWIGEVPEGWRLARIGELFRLRSGGTPSTEVNEYWEGDIPWVSAKDMKCLHITGTQDHISSSAVAESATSLVPIGTVLIVSRSGILKHTLPVAIVDMGVAINQDIKGFLHTTNRIDGLFFAYFIQGNQLTLLTQWRQQGATVESLDIDKLKIALLPLPSLGEQRTISSFLDRETARIDALVAQNQTLIERLKEKRGALISHTVTRGLPPEAAQAAGLDPKPRLKDSGVEWIGKVPEHWEATPLGRLVQFIGGATPDTNNPEFWEGDIPWISPKDMKRQRITEAVDYISSDALDHYPLRMLPERSVLIVVRGMILAHSFPVAITGLPVTINQDMKALLVGEGIIPDFLMWVLIGASRKLVSLADESAHGTRKIESEVLARFLFPMPPIGEQHAIASYLDLETAKIDALVAKVETTIERLKEYRSALITAAVTGKIDLREAAG